MRLIAYQLHARGSKAIAPISLTARVILTAVTMLAIASGAAASTSPKFGGVLRVQISEHVATVDPRQWPSDSLRAMATERLASLIFDRMVRFDDHGLPQPMLAVSWQHDDNLKRWQFRLREGVKFSDGSPLTPETAAMALQQLLGNEFDVSAISDSVVIQADHSLPEFPSQLAAGRYFIFHTADDGSLTGTGPFRVAAWPADSASKIVFLANEMCWAGRPFVDKIELTMDADPQQQANAIEFGQAEVVELQASQVRHIAQRGVRTTSSDPVDFFALRFDMARPAVQDARIREAISAAIERASIADVVLQRQGAQAASLLPNWLSGYAFLFPSAMDLTHSKQMLTATRRDFSRSTPLVLVYDSADVELRAVAERVAVNLKEAGIAVQLSGQITGSATKLSAADMRLMRQRIDSPDIAVALPALLASFGEPSIVLETPEQEYAAERAPIDAYRIIPLVHVSESYGVGPQVRDWMPPRWGGWRLEDVWLATAPVPAPGGITP
ncbi:MAG: peptide transporter, periplasmic ligand binding protein [Candidatus Acidoferrum typicum]|nr:peptide transporter, periplasmic ligand binding protein [Candidatus Acidoferrum typicum]